MESVEDQVFGFIRGDVSCADFIKWGCLHPDITAEIPDFFDVFNVPESVAEQRLLSFLELWFKQKYPGCASLRHRQRIAELATIVLEGQEQPHVFFLIIQDILCLLWDTEIRDDDDAFRTLVVIEAATDFLPADHPVAETARSYEWAYDMAVTACRELLRRFTNPPTPTV